MSKKFNIKPPTWPKEYTFVEFAKLNPHIINENQLITFYNQYLNKYLTELGEKKIHFKQSKITQLLTELQQLQQQQATIAVAGPGGGGGHPPYSLTFTGDTAATGTSDYVATTFDPAEHDLYNGFTLSFWVRPDEIPVSTHLFVMGKRNANAKERFEFGLQNASNLYIGVGQQKKTSTAHGMSVGYWYNWIITFAGGSGGALTAYRDGVDIDLASVGNGTSTWVDTDSDEPIFFGGRNLIGSYNNGWACSLDEVAIFDEVKDSDWVTSTYNSATNADLRGQSGLVGYWRFNEGSGTTVEDLSTNNNHGTLTAGTGNLPTWEER